MKYRTPVGPMTQKRKIGAAVKWTKPNPAHIARISKRKLLKSAPIVRSDDDLIDEMFRYLTGFVGSGLLFDDRAHVLYEKAAAGDSGAVQRLCHLATSLTEKLEALARNLPHLVTPIAQHCSKWPVLANASNQNREDQKRLLTKVQFCTDVDPSAELHRLNLLNTPKKRWASKLIALAFALRQAVLEHPKLAEDIRAQDETYFDTTEGYYGLRYLWGKLAEMRGKIPFSNIVVSLKLLGSCIGLRPFVADRESVEEWWGVSKELLMLCTDGHPEKVRGLKPIGLPRANHDSAITAGSIASNIRAKIIEELHEEFPRFFNQLIKAAGTE